MLPTGGVGIVGSVTAEGGIGSGAGATGSVYGGFFSSPDEGASGGWAFSGGAGSQPISGGASTTAPNPMGFPTGVVGGYTGAGGGIFITNGGSIAGTTGPFSNANFNMGIGFDFSCSWACSDDGTWMVTVTTGPGAGASVSSYPTSGQVGGNVIFIK